MSLWYVWWWTWFRISMGGNWWHRCLVDKWLILSRSSSQDYFDCAWLAMYKKILVHYILTNDLISISAVLKENPISAVSFGEWMHTFKPAHQALYVPFISFQFFPWPTVIAVRIPSWINLQDTDAPPVHLPTEIALLIKRTTPYNIRSVQSNLPSTEACIYWLIHLRLAL